jgi:DNA invertase Pin-like site-specific DNA recombinase
MNAILLARVSTDIQSYNAQVEDLKTFAISKGFNNFKIISTKESGLADLDNRDGLNELFEFINNNKEFNTILTTEISRLGRRQSVLQLVKEMLIENKIQLIVKDTKFTLFEDDAREVVSENGTMMFTLYAMFAENEIKTKKERFKRKRKDLMENGDTFFGGKVLFGYELDKLGNKNKLKKNEKNAEIIRKIFDWYLNGIDDLNKNPSILKITYECIKLGYPKYTSSKRNINKLLKEEGYTGSKITFNKYKNYLFDKKNGESEYIITQNKIVYPQIITKEIFHQVQQKIKLKVTDKKTKHTSILSNIIKCNSCGRKLSANYRFDKKSSHSYRCTSRSDTKECKEKIKSISMPIIDNLIWHLIKQDEFALLNKFKEINPNIKLTQIDNQIIFLNDKNKEYLSEAAKIQNLLNKTKFNNLNIDDLILNKTERLAKLDKYVSENHNKISKLTIDKSKIENRNINSEKILLQDLKIIEKDPIKIKEYINHFVKEIIIKKNTLKYFITQVEFKYFSNFENKEKELLDRFVTLIVYKPSPNKIKFKKLSKKLSIQNLNILNEKITKDQDFKIIEIEKLNFNYE